MKTFIKFALTALTLLFTISAVAVDYSGLYRLKSRYNRYAQEDPTAHTMSTNANLVAKDLKQLWVVEKDGTTGYKIRNANTGRYIPNSGGSDAALVTVTTPITLYIKASEGDADYLTISWNSSYSNGTCLHCNSRYNVVKWNANHASNDNPYSDWQLEPIADTEGIDKAEIRKRLGEASGLVTNITDGYYRFESVSTPGYFMTENITGTAVVAKVGNDLDYTQVWKVTTNGDTVKIVNAISEYFVRNNSANNLQFRTILNDQYSTFIAAPSEADIWVPAFTFKGQFAALSCGTTTEHKVIGGVVTNLASQWKLYKVNVDSATLVKERSEVMDEIELSRNSALYYTKLQTYFADAACTVLRDEYASMTEQELRAAMTADKMLLSLQNMAVRVLTDKWDADATRSKYVKLFRIQDVQCFSDNKEWQKITNVGPFAELINPTGIQGKAGDVVFIYADDVPASSDATLVAQLAYDTEYRNKGTLTLKKGLNVWKLPQDGEVFIGYTNSNTSRYLSEFPDIRIHIEGGTVNGYWDMSRGMVNSDWTWLKENMFQGEFLHVKGNNTVLNVLKDKVVKATDVYNIMRGWDYSFMGLEYLIGNDGQWEGRYRPVANPRHSYSGNPNWGGYGGSNHTNITSDYLFNFNNFYEGNVWEILHELGHGHQYPINVAGTTEISNNSLAQMVSFMMGRCYSRGDGTQKLVQLFNYNSDEANGHNPGLKGWSWTDYTRYATPNYDASLHVANHLLYQLYLYFEVQRHCPNFMPRLCDELRKNPIVKGSSVSKPTYYYNDYFRLAEACAKVSNTDLWEFFETYGFWKYYDEVMSVSENDDNATAKEKGIKFIGDYGGYYMKLPVRGNADDEKRIEELREFMHSRPNKAQNVFFIDDRINTSYVSATSFVAQVRRGLVGKELLPYWNLPSQGDYGHYTNFDSKDRTNNLSYSIGTTIDTQSNKTDKGGVWNYTTSGRTVSMKGSGILGIKIYDPNGKLCHIANTRSFIVPEEIAEGLEQGTYKLVVAATAGKDIELDSTGTPTSILENQTVGEGSANAPIRDLQGRIVTNTIPGQIYIQGTTKFVAE